MKKFLFTVALVTGALMAANAQDGQPLIVSAGDVSHLKLGDNMKVILVATSPATGGLTVSPEASKLLQLHVSKGTLQVTPAGMGKPNGIVYVLVQQLKSITLGEHTTVLTEGVIEAGRIKVYMDRGAVARLRTNATVDAVGLGDFDVSVTKNPAYLSVGSDVANAF